MSRTDATANFTVYVSPPVGTTLPAGSYYGPSGGTAVNGSDVTGTGTMANPFATPQHAADYLYETFDFKGQFAPTIQLACAPAPSQLYYPPLQISGQLLGQPGSLPPLVVSNTLPNYDIGKYNPFTLQGDPANPFGAFLCAGDFGFPSDRPAISLSDNASLKVTGIGLDCSSSKQDCIDVMRNSFMDISDIVWGNAGSNGGNLHVGCAFASTLFVTGNLQINGSAASWCQLGQASNLYTNNNTGQATPSFCSIVSGLKFAAGFLSAAGNSCYFTSMTYQQPASASTFQSTASGIAVSLAAGSVPVVLTDNSCCDTNGAKNIPGNVPSVILDNSVYK